MSNIPRARAMLDTVIAALDNGEITAAETAGMLKNLIRPLMIRQPARRQTERRHRLTPEKTAEIRKILRQEPDKSLQDIAQSVGVNAGRVSEILNNRRDANGKMIRSRNR